MAEIRFAIVVDQTNNKQKDPHKEDIGSHDSKISAKASPQTYPRE